MTPPRSPEQIISADRDDGAKRFKELSKAQETSANPYSLHYATLEKKILEASSASRDDLWGGGIELSEGWLVAFSEHQNDCGTYLTRFEMLKRLHLLGELSVDDEESLVAKMQRCDVFFALALAENEAAMWIFSSEATAAGWDNTATTLHGLSTALSAANSYMFGLLLKAQINRQH